MVVAAIMLLAVAWVILALALGRRTGGDLVIDAQRLMLEELRLERLVAEMDDDPEFRAQVKRRMAEGDDCTIEPWYEGSRPTARVPRRNVVPLSRLAQ